MYISNTDDCVGSQFFFMVSEPLGAPTPRNLISVRSLARDNFVSVEFDPFGFSIKDLGTQEVILRCNSNGDLYLLCAPTSLNLHASSSTPADLWHQRLGHPGRDSLLKALASFPFTCNMLGFLFIHPQLLAISLSNCSIQMFGPLQFKAFLEINTT
jgi:hypothetical protein